MSEIWLQKDTNRKINWGDQETEFTTETRSVLVEQNFDGFGNYNNLEKSKLELQYAKFELNNLNKKFYLMLQKHIIVQYNFKNSEFNELNVEFSIDKLRKRQSQLDRGISLTDLHNQNVFMDRLN